MVFLHRASIYWRTDAMFHKWSFTRAHNCATVLSTYTSCIFEGDRSRGSEFRGNMRPSFHSPLLLLYHSLCSSLLCERSEKHCSGVHWFRLRSYLLYSLPYPPLYFVLSNLSYFKVLRAAQSCSMQRGSRAVDGLARNLTRRIRSRTVDPF
jgi:hypothetical protein